tara:strand:- start:33 stop:1058 length:1026 start_codon:yes stop_codon:yes gene_type:complete
MFIKKFKNYLHNFLHKNSIKKLLSHLVPNFIQKNLLENHIKDLEKFPSIFAIETSSACNAKCWFCPQPTMDRPRKLMSTETFQLIIDQLAPFSESIDNIALFMDGEPTLNKDLPQFIKYAHDKGLKHMYFSSNMEYLTPKLIDKILDSDLGDSLEYIIASIDGVNADTHRQNRIGVDFNKAVSNSIYLAQRKKFLGKKYPQLFVRLLDNDITHNEIKDFNKFWAPYADKVLVQNMHNWGGQVDSEKLASPKFDQTKRCYFPFSQCVITYEGSVRICCVDVNNTTVVGNVHESSIQAIWENEERKRLKSNMLERNFDQLPKICEKCDYPSRGTWTQPFFWNA